jgi:hypothetical protein
MKRKWQDLDLQGGGLQALNRRLAATLLKRRTAWLLAIPLPLALYHWYLGRRFQGAAHLAACCAAAILAAQGMNTAAAIVIGIATAAGLLDLALMEHRIITANKAKRLAAYLGAGSAPPAGYRGRYTADVPDGPDDAATKQARL